ncbi:MAG: hypothetical protein FWG68_02720 [Defluviitaleaceae bacterium]|nr:hypothetical protein [Defluviitaleaceae bacterium]
MQVMNCPRCKRLFHKFIAPVCPECEKKEEEQFQELRSFVDEGEYTTMKDIAENTGIPLKRILKYIREGRLQVKQGLDDALKCIQCGQPVDKGNFCKSCGDKIMNEFPDSTAALTKAKETINKPAPAAPKENLPRGRGMFTRDKIEPKDKKK